MVRKSKESSTMDELEILRHIEDANASPTKRTNKKKKSCFLGEHC